MTNEQQKNSRGDCRWFAYLHVNGSIQTKRFMTEFDLTEADESPMVVERTGAFTASDRYKAEQIAKQLLQ